MKIPRLDRARTFAGILLFGLLAMTARNAVDPDLWWHIRTGEWIVQTGHIPHTDSFSFTRAGSPWVAHEWVSEVVFYGISKYLGTAGLILFAAMVTTAGFLILYWRCRAKPHWAAAAVALGALAAAPAWGVRPQMFTFLFASLLLWLLERGQDHPRLLLWIPPLFVLWLNLHAGFALGPALILAYIIGMISESALGETGWQEVRSQIGRLALAFVACLALIPLNPSGAELYRYPLQVLRSAGMRSFIVEWFPPDFHQLRYLPVFLIWTALLIALRTLSSRPKSRLLFPLLMTFLASLDAVRHIPIFVLLATPVIAVALSEVASARSVGSSRRTTGSPRLQLAFRVSILVLMAGFAMTRCLDLVRRQSQTEAEMFPTRAIDFLHSHPQPSRLFIYYDWGGYAVARLYPEYRVFVDGRADLYGDAILHQFQQTIQLQTGWRQVLEQSGIQSILVPPSSALAQGLFLDPGWHAEYTDSQAVLFVPHPAEKAPY
ncbi:MAG: hypothetical protein HY010_16145 [Acidobacteria bacterium]|nr:hypothetical protein [Acidobacteriota bacterium]